MKPHIPEGVTLELVGRAATATTAVSPSMPSRSIEPPPTKWASDSLSSCLDESEDPIRPCHPEHAPQAIVTNINGQSGKEKRKAPWPAPRTRGAAQVVNAGAWKVWGTTNELPRIPAITK